MSGQYDVLRLIEHNRICYVSSDRVKGWTLVQWLKYHPAIAKEKLFRWMREMLKQLQQIHKCRGNPCYQYVNPYSIIVTEEGELYYLDIKAESNAEQVRIMQRRMVREHFLPPEDAYYQRASVELDIYGVGKTIQYLLAFTEAEPALSKRESLQLQKVIQKCLKYNSKKSFKKVSEIQKHIPEYKEKTEYKNKKVLFFAAGTVIAVCIILFFPKREKEPEIAEAVIAVEESTIEKELLKELGRIYFLEMKDYEKSAEYFGQVGEDMIAENMVTIAECLSDETLDRDRMKEALVLTEEALSKEEYPLYLLCLLRSYVLLDSDIVVEDIIRLGEDGIEMVQGEEKAEIYGYLAHAYEMGEQVEKAIEMYELLLGQEEHDEAKIQLYRKITELFMQEGETGKAQEVLKEAIELYSNEKDLRIQLLKVQCQDDAIDREICRQTALQQIAELPEIKEEEEFQKLLSEYGLSLEE